MNNLKNNQRKIIRSLMMVTQIGISMMAPIFLGGLIGYYLDKHLGTGFWFLIFLFLGIGAAFRNVYLLTKPFYEKDMQREQRELQYYEDLKNYSKTHPKEPEDKSSSL